MIGVNIWVVNKGLGIGYAFVILYILFLLVIWNVNHIKWYKSGILTLRI